MQANQNKAHNFSSCYFEAVPHHVFALKVSIIKNGNMCIGCVNFELKKPHNVVAQANLLFST